MTFQEAIKAISTTAWSINYYTFCERAGFREDEYSQEKYRHWTQLAQELGQFSPAILEKIVTA